MFKLLKLFLCPIRMADYFTFYAGGGIGEAALIGAAVGGGTALVTGNDPLKGALMGGITGGIGGGISGAFGAGAGAGAAGSTAANAGTQAATAAIPSGVEAGAAAAQNASQALAENAIQAPSTFSGITWTPPQAGLDYPNFGAANAGTQVVDNVVNPATQIADLNLIPTRDLANSAQYLSGSQVQAPTDNNGIMGGVSDWWNKRSTGEKLGIGIGGGLLMNSMMGQNQLKLPEEDENPMGFATYDRNAFTASNPTPNVYRPGYAEGGITNFNNGMYPQSQQANTQYAVPSQMPTSAEVVNADYEAKTDPYTGQPTGYAEGGVTRQQIDDYLKGSMSQPAAAPAPTPAPAPALTPTSIFPPYMNAVPGVRTPLNPYGAADYGNGWIRNPSQYFSNIRNMSGIGGIMGGRGFNSMYGQPAPVETGTMAPNFQATTPRSSTSANIYRPGYAEGGIASFNLGGYAAGGNPRLLKGPGDGMSDDIPATIGGKQPARLADSEFVVPADVVSHLGNGSTDAGAKHLYNMMDRVRKARTGTKKQGKQIKAEKYLPA